MSHLKPLRAAFGTWRAVALKPKDVKAYIEKRRAKGKSNATINRELELLRRALRLAHDQGQLPVEIKVPMLEEKNTRTGFATRPQIEAVIAVLPDWLQDFTRLDTSPACVKARSRASAGRTLTVRSARCG